MLRHFIARVRDSRAFAFAQGLCEHWNGCGGRTHETNQNWNESYDRGMNAADWLRGRKES